VLAGIAVGVFGVWKAEWWLRAFTFEDDPLDAPLFAAMAVLLFGIAFVAAFVPALRATRIDPVESLRNE
jgi:ABC-type lipoprotein release transport system permease subunit